MRTPGPVTRSSALIAGSLLVASLLLMGLSGCSKPRPLTPEEQLQNSVENLRTLLKGTIKDPDRLAKMLAKVDEGAMQLRLQAAAQANLLARQQNLNLDYRATRKDFEDLASQLEALRKDSFAKSMALRSAMTGLATDAEWKTITSAKLGLLGQ